MISSQHANWRYFEIDINLLIIRFIDEKMNLNVDIMNLKIKKHSIDVFIRIDELYNLIICKNYGIDVLFERISSY